MNENGRYKLRIISSADIALAGEGFIHESEIKSMEVTARKENIPYMIIITGAVKKDLSLAVLDYLKLVDHNGRLTDAEVCGPVTVKTNSFELSMPALYIPGSKEVIIGFQPGENIHPESTDKNSNPYMNRNSLR